MIKWYHINYLKSTSINNIPAQFIRCLLFYMKPDLFLVFQAFHYRPIKSAVITYLYIFVSFDLTYMYSFDFPYF